MSELQEQQEPPNKNLPLPHEIIEEILTRLPPKSLVRFTSVSKSFLNLTKTLLQTTNYIVLKDCYWNIHLINCNSHNQITNLDPPFINAIKSLTSYKMILCVEDMNGSIYLWNPFTNKNRFICKGFGSSGDSRLSYGLGFGRNPCTKDYEVVKLVSSSNVTGMSDLLVFEVKKRVWLDSVKVPYKVRYMREGLFYNGGIHWIGVSVEYVDLRRDILIAYDIEGRMFREMGLPVGGDFHWINVAVMHGCFCVICDCDSHVEVWAMKEYGVEESWVRLFADARIKNYVGVTVKGEFLLQERRGGLCLYDPRGESLRELVTGDSSQYLSLGTRLVGSLLAVPSKKHRERER